LGNKITGYRTFGGKFNRIGDTLFVIQICSIKTSRMKFEKLFYFKNEPEAKILKRTTFVENL